MIGSSPLGVAVAAPNDTNAHVFAAASARGVFVWVPSGNTGTVTISDAKGIVTNNLTGGIVIPKGTVPFCIGPILDMADLAYQLSNGADTFSYLIVR